MFDAQHSIMVPFGAFQDSVYLPSLTLRIFPPTSFCGRLDAKGFAVVHGEMFGIGHFGVNTYLGLCTVPHHPVLSSFLLKRFRGILSVEYWWRQYGERVRGLMFIPMEVWKLWIAHGPMELCSTYPSFSMKRTMVSSSWQRRFAGSEK
jgi:hypothetical protein